MDKNKIKEYLEVLACPKCKSDLQYINLENKEGFYCKKCKLLYPIVEDIPVMLPNEALEFDISLENESS